MARGPDGAGQAQGFSLKDQLFNARTIGDLASDYAVLPGFDSTRFVTEACAGLPSRGLLERLDWLADCVEAQLSTRFGDMADALVAAMPPPLDPSKTDGDFGRFIHAVPGILAVRHGLEHHRDRALDLLEAATQRFSMEFYIRPFLNRWPDETLARLDQWVTHDNYHVRRLVSEGTRPRLPWAANITLDPLTPLRFLDALHGDPTRYVTRSVANHLNDLTRHAPRAVVQHLRNWQTRGQQSEKELAWLTRHALRTAVKRGDAEALAVLGYPQNHDMSVTLALTPDPVPIGGALEVAVTLCTPGSAFAARPAALPVMLDYRIRFHRPTGRMGEKVFKLGTARLAPGEPVTLRKVHKLKAGASTFTLHPGPHEVILQINGQDRARAQVTLTEPIVSG